MGAVAVTAFGLLLDLFGLGRFAAVLGTGLLGLFPIADIVSAARAAVFRAVLGGFIIRRTVGVSAGRTTVGFTVDRVLAGLALLVATDDRLLHGRQSRRFRSRRGSSCCLRS